MNLHIWKLQFLWEWNVVFILSLLCPLIEFLFTGMPKTPSEAKWLNKTLDVGSVIGVDPYLLEADAWRDLSRELQGGGHSLIPVPENLIDLIWTDRPPRPAECVVPLEVLNSYGGLTLCGMSESIGSKFHTLWFLSFSC